MQTMGEFANRQSVHLEPGTAVLGSPFGLAIFIIGIVILGLCVLGLFGACCNSHILLIVYAILHGILLIAEIIVVIIYAAKPNILTDPLKGTIDTMTANYVSVNSTDTDSMVMKALMFALQCCGSNDGGDFKNSTKFKRTQVYDKTTYTLMYPVPCCKFDQSNQPVGSCPGTFDSVNSNIRQGCWKVLKGYIDRYGMMAVYVSIGVILLQVILEAASIVMVCSK
ncbi:unnamed protein product [Dicrocoelium dendriticum]|nr:unnamed protein product [Dicrocoelium dendriticum]